MGMTLVQVNHQAKQFAVNLKKAPKRGLSKVGGTQCLDRAWGILKKWLPKQLNIKKNVQRTWRSQSSPEGEDVSMALASQSECERKVHTDANVPGAWKAVQVACLSVENDADAAAHRPPATA